ncbi:MAG: valine--tRNA ligase [Armatimonadetes bacterium]|nr:valine--tRNA ligase [Armatimonadota bacterium]
METEETTQSAEIELSKTYDPASVEEKWYRNWMESNSFLPKDGDSPPFCIVIPPPNVTGSLHMGHALDNTLQDILVRWRRMLGERVLWLPGTDHAGIATQTVVEKELKKEGKSRHSLGRDEFIRRVWSWKEQYGGVIIEQLKRLGASCDWSRLRFTMDEACSEAVREAFFRLFQEGLIYRGEYIINWCPRCLTALSDLEVEHEEVPDARLHYIRYPFKGEDPSTGEALLLATTRPETILADVAIAVSPDDPKHKHNVGKTVILPLVGRELPIIEDSYVDPEFGTGAVKITPAHDPNDFLVGKRHNLPCLKVIDERGRMNQNAEEYTGGKIASDTDRFKARDQVIQLLQEAGLYDRERSSLPYSHSIGVCYRCHTPIEPYLSLQWFVRMKELAAPAILAVKEGRTRFIPERFTRTYLYWMENIKDWCISRQLWWGHRIPVWYCDSCGRAFSSRKDPDTCERCGGALTQDPDVLDTWFSSALWPFSTLGWPESTKDLETWYPTSVLVTARDIIFLWVARMIMSGLHFMDKVPFRDVHIHATILDKTGRRMSKSLGTGVDPLELIEKYGADATRMGLIAQTQADQDIRFNREKIEICRNFANKLWNAARFVHLTTPERANYALFPVEQLGSLPDRWIMSALADTVATVTNAMEAYDFGTASQRLITFLWNEYCDWYVEIAKEAVSQGGPSADSARAILRTVLLTTIKLLHPFMPFVTEEIWHLFTGEGSIMTAPWPRTAEFERYRDRRAEEDMGLVMEVVRAFRNLRQDVNLSPKQAAEMVVETGDAGSHQVLESAKSLLSTLANAHPITLRPPSTEAAPRDETARRPMHALSARTGSVEIFLPLSGLIDISRELERLDKERARLENDLAVSGRKLSDQAFVSKAKPEVVERERQKNEGLRSQYEKISARVKNRISMTVLLCGDCRCLISPPPAQGNDSREGRSGSRTE